ncbi:carbohydrate ABC transporter substrate-binding protein (CUT1 family) [Curtobacterium flaccumfaciens]|uniref:Carbohydrate ABC transporter substrate-binding protein (CUT1 family) n=1 Tax=Curtobacterium flaccumfaciens TaxID=2035 RepID=A0A4R6DK33_9MICO|nr:ABC transporter substrate-binding protein [Curtobacterium flaccumfaciens]TDN45097.1 carbohydrate ABC transporter substrate-binding protein (CUT1 family) [Curtobacterium flaccumfaciens]
MKTTRARVRFASVAGVAVIGLVLTGCSSGSSASDDSKNGQDSRGPITYVQGKDNSNVVRPLIAKWNKAHPDEKVTFKEQSDQADQQHDDLVQHFQAKDENYDVVDVDVVWTAEFAAKGWLTPLTGKMKIDTSKLLPATVKTATYNNTLYAAPQTSDGALLYYRKDLVKTPPTTWADMMKDCDIAKQAGIGCYAGQFAKYEGLTVNASEAINGSGGSVLSKSGTPDVDTSDAKAGLQNLVDAFKDGNIPAEAITYQEEQGRTAFEDGKLLFLRNWPYVYSLAKTDGSSKVKDTFGIAPIPGADGTGASTLGGHNAAISVYSKHKATAHDFLEFLESNETQKFFATQGSLAPVVGDLYTDSELTAKLPYLPTLLKSIESAEPRPVTPFYPAVTKAIQDNTYAALKGSKSVDEAMKDMQAALKTATSSGS